jgi:hypothetical protein
MIREMAMARCTGTMVQLSKVSGIKDFSMVREF